MNSLAQGGLPLDVAEAIAWFASPGSAGVTGNVRAGLRPVADRSLVVAVRELSSSPRMLPLFARAGAGADPGRVADSVRRERRCGRRARPDAGAQRRGRRPRSAGGLRPGVWVLAARPAAGHLSAHPRLPDAAGADDRRELPVPGHRPGPHPQPDHPAPAGPARRGAVAAGLGHARGAAPARPAVLASQRGERRWRGGVGGGLDQPSPGARLGVGSTARRFHRPASSSRPPCGSCRAIWGAATARCRAT